MLNNIASLILTYLFSAIPFGLLIGKIFYGKDIRKTGSENIGATNVMRTCGKIAGISTFLLDGLKGAIPILLYKQFFTNTSTSFEYLIGFIAILGHIFPIYLKFKGGKGVATTILVLFALNLKLGFLAAGIFGVFLILFGYVSLASIMMSLLLLPFSAFEFAFNENHNMLIFNLGFAFLLCLRHTDNIKRLLNGEEGKMFKKSIFY
jgi:glycerol-3-phosphate acyltransferase PlsY